MLSVVFLCIEKAATHDITRWNITECSKFQVFISYSFRVIFFTEIMREGAVDNLKWPAFLRRSVFK